MYETKEERMHRYEQTMGMMKLSHGSDAKIDPEIDAIMLDWVEKGGDWKPYQKRIDIFLHERYGVELDDEDEE